MKDDKILIVGVKKYAFRKKKQFLQELESEEFTLVKLSTKEVKLNDSEEY